MELSLTTDFMESTGLAEEALRLAAQAGFTHIHWCHHWSDDFIYTEPEIEKIGKLLSDNNLKLLDVHGSHSASGEKCWFSTNETYRRAGVELVKNRIEFTYRLGGDCVVMHGPAAFQPKEDFKAQLSALNKSLDELEEFAHNRNIKLALENSNTNYADLLIPVIMNRSKDFLGFCYDSGHHNIKILLNETEQVRKELNEMRNQLADRLLATHIHDNNGYADNHWIPFIGTIDWNDVVEFLKLANYKKPINLELSYHNTNRLIPMSKEEFVKRAYEAGIKLAKMISQSE